MNTTTCASPVPAFPGTPAVPTSDPWAPLRALGARLTGWLAARRQASADGELLANLSERELLDIGMPVDATPNARDAWWPADYPR